MEHIHTEPGIVTVAYDGPPFVATGNLAGDRITVSGGYGEVTIDTRLLARARQLVVDDGPLVGWNRSRGANGLPLTSAIIRSFDSLTRVSLVREVASGGIA